MNKVAQPPAPSSSPVPPRADATRALIAGSVWALTALLVPGLGWLDLTQLAMAAALTQWLVLLSVGALSAEREFRRWVLLAASLLGVLSAFMGRVLLAYTHHRPLGAVTWALLCLGALLPIAALATRFKSAWPRFLPPFVLLFLLWAARAELSGAIGVQLGVGLMCAAAALIHRARQPLGGARFGWIALGAIALGVAFVFVSGQLPRLSEEAPLLLGAVGLLV